MDVVYLGIGVVFFVGAGALVKAFAALQGGTKP